jgi:hypothetical protein
MLVIFLDKSLWSLPAPTFFRVEAIIDNAPFIVESWFPENPASRARTGFADFPGADAFARTLAADGEDAVVLAAESSYLAEPHQLFS